MKLTEHLFYDDTEISHSCFTLCSSPKWIRNDPSPAGFFLCSTNQQYVQLIFVVVSTAKYQNFLRSSMFFSPKRSWCKARNDRALGNRSIVILSTPFRTFQGYFSTPVGGLPPDCLWFSLQVMKEWIIMPLSENKFEIDHHTGDYPPYFIRLSGCGFFDFFNIPQNVLHVPSLWDGAYGLSTLSEMTKKSNLLQMLLQT